MADMLDNREFVELLEGLPAVWVKLTYRLCDLSPNLQYGLLLKRGAGLEGEKEKKKLHGPVE